MKKIITLLLAVIMVFSMFAVASAATINITSVETNNDRDVTFTFEATGLTAGESQITVAIYEEDDSGNVLPEKVAYVNQFTYTGTNTFTANMLSSFPRGTYFLAVGGDGVSTPATSEFIEYIYGDVIKDGVVNAADILFLAKKLAGYSNVQFDSRAQTVADVTHDGVVSSEDLLKLLRYLANYGSVTSLD